MTTQTKPKRRTASARAALPKPRLFSVDEYARMWETDIFHPEERLELIDGAIVVMPGIGPPHAACVIALVMWFSARLAGRALVSPQNSLPLTDYWAPQPDVMLLNMSLEEHRGRLPRPAEVFLLIEVSDTTLAYDRTVKLPGYARAGIPEVWIVELNGAQVFAYREPRDGTYTVTRTYKRGVSLSPLAFPDLELLADEILG